jgi:hypothetical protein
VHGATTHSGNTNAKGEFQYEPGDSVTFSIGDITFPPVNAKSTVTPLDVAGTSDVHDTSVVNIARLLQSLDSDSDSDSDGDGDASDGIKIGDAAHTAATGMSGLNFSGTAFVTAVTNLVANSGSKNTALVDADSAIQHFTESALAVSGGIPSKFSMEWLSGRTLYIVFYDGERALPVVIKGISDADSGTVVTTNLMNGIGADDENPTHQVVDGSLRFDGSFRSTIVCGSTSKYIKTHLIDTEADAGKGVFDSAELLFFNEADAVAYAATLTKGIEPCNP